MPEELKLELDPFILKLKKEREDAVDYQKRRHDQWNENYTLYRDTVQINRLTQRQSVNIPLMKETLKTLLSDMDDFPSVGFQNLDKIKKPTSVPTSFSALVNMTWDAKEREYNLNELWTYEIDRLDIETLDILDKKNVLLYGRSFRKLNFMEGLFDIEVMDIYDIVVDPKMKPNRIDSARYLVHQNIYRPLGNIITNEKYSKKGVKALKDLMYSEKGLILGADNRKALEEKKERMQDMGAENYKTLEEILAGSEVIVSLTEHYTHKWNGKEYEKWVAVVAQDEILLYDKSLKECLGVDFWPFVTWAADIDTSDVWTDGEADVVRTINKVINAWISQGVENRTLLSWGMKYYDSTKGFDPQSWTPTPFGWYPVPGNPNELIKDVEIKGLSDSMNEINFLISLVEKATATPPQEKGIAEKRQITLGEIQLVLGKASERVKTTAKFYRRATKELAKKWYAIMEANVAPSESITLYRQNFKGGMSAKTMGIKDWKSEAGYRIKVVSSSEQEAEETQGIQKLVAIKTQFPDNPVLAKVFERRLLEIGDLSSEEIREIMEYEEQKLRAIPQQGAMPPQGAMIPPAPQPMPAAIPKKKPISPEALQLRQSTNRLKQLISV